MKSTGKTFRLHVFIIFNIDCAGVVVVDFNFKSSTQTDWQKNVTSFLVKAYIMSEWRLSIAHIFAVVDATLEDKKIEFSHLNYFIENHDYTNLFVFKEHKWGKGLLLSLKRDLFHFLQHIPVTNSQKMEINK